MSPALQIPSFRGTFRALKCPPPRLPSTLGLPAIRWNESTTRQAEPESYSMKVLLSNILIALFLSLGRPQDAFCHATPTPVPPPTVKSQELVCRTKQQDLELRDWIIGIQDEAQKAKGELDAANKSNADTQTKLTQAIQDGKELAAQCEKWQQCYQHPFSCGFHRLMKHLLWIGIVIVVLLIALCVASIFVPALAPIMGFLLSIWKRILGLFKPKPPVP